MVDSAATKLAKPPNPQPEIAQSRLQHCHVPDAPSSKRNAKGLRTHLELDAEVLEALLNFEAKVLVRGTAHRFIL